MRAVEKVRDRLARATAALEAAGIEYAVVGGNAVAAWVSQVDETAVRNTPDVDILLRRSDLDAAKNALVRAGFVYRHVRGLDILRDGPESSMRDSVNIVFAGEKHAGDEAVANPDVEESEQGDQYRITSLEALVRMKLNSWRLKDRVHLQDMWEVGLIGESWVSRFPPELGTRLRNLIDTAEENSSLSYRSRE